MNLETRTLKRNVTRGRIFRFPGRLYIIWVMLASMSCRSFVLKSPAGDQSIRLGSFDPSEECRIVAEEKQWSALWGLSSLNDIDPVSYMTNVDKTYRITNDWTTADVLISISAGFLGTITRNTVLVEECDGNNQILDQQAKGNGRGELVRGIQSEYLSQIREIPEKKGLPVFVMEDGSLIIGRIRKQTDDFLILETPESVLYNLAKKPSRIKNDSNEVISVSSGSTGEMGNEANGIIRYEDRIQLNNGEVFFGKIARQSMSRIGFVRRGQYFDIHKRDIASIQYEVPRKASNDESDTMIRILRWREETIPVGKIQAMVEPDAFPDVSLNRTGK